MTSALSGAELTILVNVYERALRGQPFDVDELADGSGFPRDELGAAFDLLTDRGLVFTHHKLARLCINYRRFESRYEEFGAIVQPRRDAA